jgi:exopolyphosphatase
MTSAILYAYTRSLSPPRNAFTQLYVPVTNIPAADIHLRPEFLAVFRRANIEAGHLITLDDLPNLSMIEDKLRPENTKWILVDHNALQGQLGKIYSSRVGGVIDHHDDESKVPQDTEPEPRVIEKSGSCTSLVTEYCRHAWDQASESALSSGAAHAQGDSFANDSAVTRLWDAQVAQLGLASILIDTSNLQSQDKTTEHDRNAVSYLESMIMLCPQLSTSFKRSALYKEVNAAKKNIGDLKLHDILRKDYKQWDENGQVLGISSVVRPISFLQQKAGNERATESTEEAFQEVLRSFAKERSLDMYALMTTSKSDEGEFQRELLVWTFSDSASSSAQKFVADAREELGLEERQVSASKVDQGGGPKVWRQRNTQHSRKRVAPLLREAMR